MAPRQERNGLLRRFAPRNDGKPKRVVPAKAGTNTPRPLDSIIGVSGIRDHPLSRVTTVGSVTSQLQYQTADTASRSRRMCASFCRERFRPGGRGERRMPNAPAASRAKCRKHTSIVTTGPPDQPGAPARNGFNGFLRALPGDRLVVTVACGLRYCLHPVGPTNLRQLDASAGASGPHDFSVRVSISRLCAVRSLTGLRLPCDHIQRSTLPRPPHPAPYVRDDRETPLCVRRDSY
jgi:hypothetical protein